MSGSKNQAVWTGPKCLVCLATIAYEILQKSTKDPQLQITGMKKTYELLNKFSITNPPTDVANEIYRMIQELTKNIDPFKDIKRRSNELAKETMQLIQAHIRGLSNPEERFYRALAAAIAGNLIDFGTAGHTIHLNAKFLEETYYEIIEEGFAIDHSTQLFAALEPGKEVVYIADNAGEIYFDWFVLEQMKSLDVRTILVVKGAPISNDATMEDVEDLIFEEVTTKIITTGAGAVGVSVTKSSREFLNLLQTADFIVAKGQSNFETLYYYHKELTQKPIFFIFRTKCASIANFLGQPIGKSIVMQKKT